MHLACSDRILDLSRPLVMGILNVTPDSFSDGGRYDSLDAALERARQMSADGADIIDVGGESTRPGAAPVSADEEIERVIPVIEAVAADHEVVVSVDTSKPEVMREAVRAGAVMINDVNALRAPGALAVAAGTRAAVCLMHMQGEPRTMQQNPVYDDVVGDIGSFLAGRVKAATAAGISRDRLVIDPGFGFGKTLAHNLEILARLEDLAAVGLPVMAGLSRKSMIGALLGDRPAGDRLHGSVAAAVIAAMKGARILRVHDVAATKDSLRVAVAVMNEEERH